MMLGKTIKKIREQKGLKQLDVAEKSGLSNKYLSRVEQGSQIPPIPTLERICKALNVELPYLMIEYYRSKRNITDAPLNELDALLLQLQEVFETK
jgi:transcriptional regulator with XRE-family HTH domain